MRSNSARVTGCTESRPMRTRAIFASSGSALISSSVTGRARGATALSSTATQPSSSAVWSGNAEGWVAVELKAEFDRHPALLVGRLVGKRGARDLGEADDGLGTAALVKENPIAG